MLPGTAPSRESRSPSPPALLAVATLAVGLLAAGLGTIGVAGAAAVSTQAASPPKICSRVRVQFARLALAAKRTKVAFARARALQTRLARTGRTALAHRLDARIAHLRQVRDGIVARVKAIALQVHGVCSEHPPTLASF